MDGYYVYADQDTFYEALANFTKEGENSRFLSDIVYADDNTIEVPDSGTDAASRRANLPVG